MSQNIHENVTRLADGYIDQAVTQLQAPLLDEDAVHNVRVATKQLRGLVRLYRKSKADPSQDEAAIRINAVLRDIAKVFSSQRDAHVLEQTLQQVARRSDKATARQLMSIRDEILWQTANALPDMTPARLIEQLELVRALWLSTLVRKDDAMFDALERLYRRSRRDGWQALNSRDVHLLHQWRKRVKYLYYQLSAWPGATDWRSSQLESLRLLGSLLGKVHDLDVLNDYLQEGGQDAVPLLRQVHKRRVRMVKKIRRLYSRAFVHTKKDFRRKMQAP